MNLRNITQKEIKRRFGSKVLRKRDVNDNFLIGINNYILISRFLNGINKYKIELKRKKKFKRDYDLLLKESGKLNNNLPQIKDGWLKIDNPHEIFENFDRVVDAGESILNKKISESDKANDNHFIPVETIHEFENYPEILNFGLNPNLLKIVGEYLETIPVLRYINVIESPPVDPKMTIGSQLFHKDIESKKVARVIVLVDDIDSETGPFSFFPTSVSKKIDKNVKYGHRGVHYRVSDDKAYECVKESDLVVAEGNRGDVFICDTSNCFHYGSRGQTKPRRVFMLSYTSTIADHFNQMEGESRSEYRNLAKYENSLLSKLVLDDKSFA